MKKSLTKGLDKEKAEQLELNFKHSAETRERLIELIGEKLVTADNTSTSKNSYDIANWAYLQADLVGYKRALKEIISLLS